MLTCTRIGCQIASASSIQFDEVMASSFFGRGEPSGSLISLRPGPLICTMGAAEVASVGAASALGRV
eukprot:4221011-Prymnesium_polylepis.2